MVSAVIYLWLSMNESTKTFWYFQIYNRNIDSNVTSIFVFEARDVNNAGKVTKIPSCEHSYSKAKV